MPLAQTTAVGPLLLCSDDRLHALRALRLARRWVPQGRATAVLRRHRCQEFGEVFPELGFFPVGERLWHQLLLLPKLWRRDYPLVAVPLPDGQRRLLAQLFGVFCGARRILLVSHDEQIPAEIITPARLAARLIADHVLAWPVQRLFAVWFLLLTSTRNLPALRRRHRPAPAGNTSD